MDEYDASLDNLIVVLRESQGGNKQDDALQPAGPIKATMQSRETELHPAWFEFIGDIHLRFVFDGLSSMLNLTLEEFAEFRLDPQEAVTVAMRNIKRDYGEPQTSPWAGGLTAVHGECPDLDSSYFVDREFWEDQLRRHPDGLVAGVPKRGGLLFAPASDGPAVEGFRRGIGRLFTSSEAMRVSSGLYLFSEGRWSVFQDPRGELASDA